MRPPRNCRGAMRSFRPRAGVFDDLGPFDNFLAHRGGELSGRQRDGIGAERRASGDTVGHGVPFPAIVPDAIYPPDGRTVNSLHLEPGRAKRRDMTFGLRPAITNYYETG